MNLIFREYTENDKPFLVGSSYKLEEYVKSIDPLQRIENNPGFAEASTAEILEKVEKHQGKIILAEDEGKVIGGIIGILKEHSEINTLEIGKHIVGEVIHLFIDEGYRNKGLGTKMLQMVEIYFKELGCDSMWISLFAPNEVAHNTYKKFGFEDREIGMLKKI